MDKNELYYGDNLEVLKRYIKDETVDLVYLDPPFNSNRNYSVIFSRQNKVDDENSAQIEAFEDTWHWTSETETQFDDFVQDAPPRAADAITAFRTLLGENDAMAYLVNMAPRLHQLHRVLKSTGSLYLHCDPTMSHYLKILLDSIFGAQFFRSEIIWKRTGSHGSAKRYGPVHDVILFYVKSNQSTWNKLYGPYEDSYIEDKFSKVGDNGELFQDISLTGPDVRNGESGLPWRGVDPTQLGRHWALPGFLVAKGIISGEGTTQEQLDKLDEVGRIYWTKKGNPRLKFYVDDAQGMPLSDVWTNVAPINSQAAERLGYPTQKPLTLMERIINASSNPGDIVLDPFCGCGTTVDAAQRLGRQWIGIDVTYISIDLIKKRLQHTYGDDILDTFRTNGIPSDLAAARALFSQSPFDFERWAVSLVNAKPNEKQVGDRGIDGVARFPLGQKGKIGKVLVSVKGGKNINPGMVRDLLGTVNTEKAAMGIFLTLTAPTKGVQDAINHGGVYTHPANNQTFPKLQTFTVGQLMQGLKPQMPATYLPYIEAKPKKGDVDDDGLFDL